MYYTIGYFSLGYVLVAQSEKGVSAIFFGDDEGELVGNLAKRFPKEELIREDGRLKGVLEALIRFIEVGDGVFNLPLDMQGTAFQRQVWQAISEIPRGKTVSYSDIAHRIGLPKSMRAVAQACGANPVAVVVPCHRVVRQDGGISGYRWGVERKRQLLARENINV